MSEFDLLDVVRAAGEDIMSAFGQAVAITTVIGIDQERSEGARRRCICDPAVPEMVVGGDDLVKRGGALAAAIHVQHGGKPEGATAL